MQLLEPWVFLRLLAGLVATALLVRASVTAIQVLRRFDVMRVTEGQLLLERRVELAGTFVRVGAAAQVVALLLSALAADKLSRGIRGAMCAYGTFHSSPLGFRSLYASVIAALAAGTLAQLFSFDARTKTMDLVRPLAIGTLLVAPLAIVDLVMQTAFLLDLDLSVVASCCSVQLDPIASARAGTVAGPRIAASIAAAVAVGVCILLAVLVARRPTRPAVALASAAAFAALPLALAATVLEIAPYAFEVPQHHCPFCLLRADTWGLGYPLFGALLLAAVWSFGAGISALLARKPPLADAWRRFAASRLRRGALAWSAFVILGLIPIVRYAVVSHGASLFP